MADSITPLSELDKYIKRLNWYLQEHYPANKKITSEEWNALFLALMKQGNLQEETLERICNNYLPLQIEKINILVNTANDHESRIVKLRTDTDTALRDSRYAVATSDEALRRVIQNIGTASYVDGLLMHELFYTADPQAQFDAITKDFEDFEKKYKRASRQAATKPEAPKTIEAINAKATDALLDAYDDRRKHFGMNVVPADEMRKSRLNTVTANYTGLSVQTAEAFNDAITRLSDDYYTGYTRIEVANPKEMFGVSEFATTRHLNAVGQKTLVINPNKAKDYNKLVERVEELAKKGYAVKIAKGKAGEYIATHEFAHSLLDIGGGSLKNYVGLDVKLFQKARKEIEAVFAQYAKEVGELERAYRSLEGKFMLADDIDEMAALQKEAKKAKEQLDKVKISGYSMQNADEFMAEAFTQAQIGEQQSSYTDEVMKIIDKYFKK
jgi:hypothetical protein